MDFKVNKLANGAKIAANDHSGIVNGSNSFIEKLSISANGREVYSCNYGNDVVNIKKLLRVVQYSQIDSIGVSGDKKGLHWYQWYDWYQ